jgi:hypothetical protein
MKTTLPIYIVSMEMQFSNDILYATTDGQDAIEFFDNKCKFISNRICYCLYEIIGESKTIIKIK